jgi:hypothetical protein
MDLRLDSLNRGVAQNGVQILAISFPKCLCLPMCSLNERALGEGWRTPDMVGELKTD